MNYEELKNKVKRDTIDGLNICMSAYAERSFDEGYKLGVSISEDARKEGYKEGLEKARRVMLRMYDLTIKKDVRLEDLTRMFGYNAVSVILENYTIDEIDARFNDFIEQRRIEDTSIHIGDEVKYLKDTVVVTSIVTRPTGMVVNGICEADGLAITMPFAGLVKTGKHFDDIMNFLTQNSGGKK